jgi:hypothetical protein
MGFLVMVALGIGVVIGFIAGWLVRDAAERPLTRPGERIGVGVPHEWYQRQRAEAQD